MSQKYSKDSLDESVTERRLEIAREQGGFVKGKLMSNAILMLRAILERALEVLKEIRFDCFSHQGV